MHQTLVMTCALLVTPVAAARSTWSPCGISMLSTLTPYGERHRGHSYAATVTWFILGATLGGAMLGAMIAALAALVAFAGWSAGTVTAIAAVACVVTIASDLRLAGLHLPLVPRQVNEEWVSGYRRWVYAVGFGAQIGVGVSTYVMTAAVYLMVALGALSGSPLTGWLIGVGFGAARGVAILLGAGLSNPVAIRRFHERFEELAPISRTAAIVAQAGSLVIVAERRGGLALAGCLVGATVVAAVVSRRLATVRSDVVGSRA
jgi:MFS family permease